MNDCDPLFSLRLALLAHDANQRDHEPFVAEWTYVEAVIEAARALVGVPLTVDEAGAFPLFDRDGE